MRRLLDGVAMRVPHRSTEPERPRHPRNEHPTRWLVSTQVALVFGTESTGVSNELLAACDRRVYVPQHGFADSLNVGVAAALATSHAVWKSTSASGDHFSAMMRPVVER